MQCASGTMRTRSYRAHVVSTEEPARPEAQHCQYPLDHLPPDPYRKRARALWQRQSHADNFTDGAFLSALVVNAQLTRRSYWQVLPFTAGLGCSSKQSPRSIVLLRDFTEPLTAEDSGLEPGLEHALRMQVCTPLIAVSRLQMSLLQPLDGIAAGCSGFQGRVATDRHSCVRHCHFSAPLPGSPSVPNKADLP